MALFAEEDIVSFFQPIIGVDNYDIFGYEVLGRLNKDNDIVSLGPFFMNKEIALRQQLEVDRIIRRKALEYYSQSNSTSKLFLNIKPQWIYQFMNDPENIPTLQLLRHYHIDPSKIVIEITEENFSGKLSMLSKILKHYKNAGCKIDSRYIHYNWCWRPYFLQTILKMLTSSMGVLTGPYRDITTKQKIYTFSFPLDGQHFLFIDILSTTEL
ncbi:MAG: hypothetical protein PWP27_1667 [Clostridiales bacterium]|jgi:hypothetical protein|nr:hypothetical protein [Clostridiales bacterium]